MVRPAACGLFVAFASIAAAATGAPSLRETVEITDLSSVALSPDGKLVAYRAETASIARNAYDLSWFVVPADGRGAPRRIADAGEGDWPDGTLFGEPPLWSPDGTTIYFRAVAAGAVQVWRAGADGSGASRLTDEPGNVLSLVWSADHRRLVYGVGPSRAEVERAESLEYDRGVRIDARVDPARQLFRGSRIEGRLASDRLSGFWFAHGNVLAGAKPRYRSLAIGAAGSSDASPADVERLVPPARPFDMLDGRMLLARADSGGARGSAIVLADGRFAELAVRRPDRAASVLRCNHPQCRGQRIVDAGWTPSADRVVFTTSDDATNQSLHLWDVRSGAVLTVGGGNGRLNGGRDDLLGCAIGDNAAYCVAASANVPPHLVRVDFASRRTVTLAAPNAGLAAATGPQFTAFSWPGPSGLRFNGQLLLPSGPPRRWPLFVTYYVCDGYLRGGTGDDFPLRALAAHGIAALCINRAPTTPGLGDQIEQYRIAQQAVASAIDALDARGLVDRGRVGMGGVSFGGEATLWVAAHGDLLAAMSVSNSVLTPTYYWFGALPGREVPGMLQKVWGIGDPDRDSDRWRTISPAFAADKIRTPLLMQLPELEYRINVELVARLARAGTPADLWAFPYETHIKYQPRHKLAIYERNLDWFRYWLAGDIDPDPAKRDQLDVWRAYARKPGWNDAQRAQGSPSQARNQRSVSASGSSR